MIYVPKKVFLVESLEVLKKISQALAKPGASHLEIVYLGSCAQMVENKQQVSIHGT